MSRELDRAFARVVFGNARFGDRVRFSEDLDAVLRGIAKLIEERRLEGFEWNWTSPESGSWLGGKCTGPGGGVVNFAILAPTSISRSLDELPPDLRSKFAEAACIAILHALGECPPQKNGP